jgi:quercetin dioxygenase-like cupin family protein
MNHSRLTFLAIAAMAAAAAWGIRALHAQQPGFTRVELQRHDLSAPGHEAVVARVEFAPGGAVGKHTHPGEENGYVLEGAVQVEVEGKPPVTVKAGEVFFVPAGTVHAARNTAAGPSKVLATYFVEKGKPLATLVK